VSHEEPDLPDSPTEGPRPVAPSKLQGHIDIPTVVSGLIVATIMGASYPYMVLKLGFGPNVSVVSAFFGFLLLMGIDLLTRQKKYSRWQNNIVEAAGTSAAQTAFMCVLLGAFDILHHDAPGSIHIPGLEGAGAHLPRLTSFLWLTAACSLGVLMAVPLRRHFVVDEKLPFVDGLSTAETLIVLDPPRDASAEVRKNSVAAAKAVMIGVIASGVLMLFREDSKLMGLITGWWEGLPEGHYLMDALGGDIVAGTDKLTLTGGFVLANMGVGWSYSLLSIGSGMLVGFRVNASMLGGGILAWVIAPYFLVKYGVAPVNPDKTTILHWVMWPATGMLVAGGLTALGMRWRLLVSTFTSLRAAKIDDGEFPLRWVIIGCATCAIALCVLQRQLLNMPIWMTLAAIVLSVPLMLVGLRVLGETNWGPISALSNMMQGLFALVAPHNIGANMVASGTTGTVATSSEAIMQDYKSGELLGTKPRMLTIMQLIAVPVGALATSLIYPALVSTYGEVGAKGSQLSSPISVKWAGFAELLEKGIGALAPSAFDALIVFVILGIIFTVLESNAKLKKWVPSPTGIGIGILVPFSVVFTMFLGGIAGMIWERADKKSADLYMVPLSSGFIAGEALIAVIAAAILFAVGT
jgi:uncharacterized oligopeptide transporter (OPT) family protein